MSRKYFMFFAALSVSAFATCAMAAGTLDLAVRGHAPEYAILRAADASPSVVYAAEELREHVRRMTDVELPIVTDYQPQPPAKAIVLGRTKYNVTIGEEEVELDGETRIRFYAMLAPRGLVVVVRQCPAPYYPPAWVAVQFQFEGIDSSNATGALTLSGNAAINLEGGALAFADSSGVSWKAGATLTITDDDKLPTRSLRFGSSENGLTAARLRQITYNGERVSLDSGGYLRHRRGLILIVK